MPFPTPRAELVDPVTTALDDVDGLTTTTSQVSTADPNSVNCRYSTRDGSSGLDGYTHSSASIGHRENDIRDCYSAEARSSRGCIAKSPKDISMQSSDENTTNSAPQSSEIALLTFIELTANIEDTNRNEKNLGSDRVGVANDKEENIINKTELQCDIQKVPAISSRSDAMKTSIFSNDAEKSLTRASGIFYIPNFQ